MKNAFYDFESVDGGDAEELTKFVFSCDLKWMPDVLYTNSNDNPHMCANTLPIQEETVCIILNLRQILRPFVKIYFKTAFADAKQVKKIPTILCSNLLKLFILKLRKVSRF